MSAFLRLTTPLLHISIFSLVLICAACLGCCSAHAENAEAKVVTLKFPSDKTLGALCLVKPGNRVSRGVTKQAVARGEVTINVPAGQLLMYEPNQYVIMHPELLNSVPPQAIDVLRIAFMSMDAGEEKYCDRALKYASHFSHASYLSVAYSDASDAGILSISKMPNIKTLWASCCSMRGRFLEDVSEFPNLEEIDVSECNPFDQTELKNLLKLPKLKRLYLGSTGLGPAALKTIARCKSLELLDVRQNKLIDNEAILPLLALKSLRHLALSGTSVNTNGLKVLAQMHLRKIVLPADSYSPEEFARIVAILPGTGLATKNRRTAEANVLELVDGAKMLAPLKRQ